MKVGCIPQGIRSQSKMDHLWPGGACVEQLLARTFQEVLDGLLGNVVLEVGIYPTEHELLPCFVACLSEGVVVEASVVTMVV